MVSLYSNPPAKDFFNPMKMGTFLGSNSLSSTTDSVAVISTSADDSSMNFGSEDPSDKKVRKPYTITKSRETWTDQEHDKFIEALHLFDRDWKKIEAFVGSKTVIQIRSHAQKYFLKVQKNGTSEHVPPPRPKRKAAHPYPQKAPKNGPMQSSAAMPGFVITPDSLSVPRNAISSSAMSSWTNNTLPPVNASHVKDDVGLSGPAEAHNCRYSSNSNTPRMWSTSETTNQGVNHSKPMKVMPDFAQVYSFIGSVFDSNASGHLHRLKMMDPINVETVLLLMKNLAVNLTSPEFEDHRKLISSYDVDTEKIKPGSYFIDVHADKRGDVIQSV